MISWPVHLRTMLISRLAHDIVVRLSVLFFLGIAGCSDHQHNTSIHGRHGFSTRIYHGPQTGQSFRYTIFVPQHREVGEKLPAILFLNGKGENGSDGVRQISNNFGVDIWRKREQFPFLAICPQCSRDGNWNPSGPDARRAMAILDEVMSEFDVDPDRVYLTGVSLGGSGVWAFAAAHPERFAAIVPISAVGSEGAARIAAKTRLPVWGFYNGRDNQGVVQSGRTARKVLLEAGLSPLMTEYDQLGHNAWHSYDNPFLYEWLLRQSRSKNAGRPSYKLWGSEQVREQWDATNLQTWLGQSTQSIQNNTELPDALGLIVCPDSLRQGEIHLDTFLSKEQLSRIHLRSESGDWTCEVAVGLSTSGVAGVILNRTTAIPFDPVAQRALRSGWNDIRIARDPNGISISLNGWTALTFADPIGKESIRWAVTATPEELDSRWRYLRTIELSH